MAQVFIKPAPELKLENLKEIWLANPKCKWKELTQELVLSNKEILDLKALCELMDECRDIRIKNYIEMGHTRKEALSLTIFGKTMSDEEFIKAVS